MRSAVDGRASARRAGRFALPGLRSSRAAWFVAQSGRYDCAAGIQSDSVASAGFGVCQQRRQKIHRALFGFADAAAAEPTVENQRFFAADGFIDGRFLQNRRSEKLYYFSLLLFFV